MGDVSTAETKILVDVKEAPQENLMMRWGDDGSPATLYLSQKKGEYVRDERTGLRRSQDQEVAVTPVFTQSIAPGSIMDFGEGQTFEVTKAPNKVTQEKYPNSVYIKRIPLENGVDGTGKRVRGFNTISKELLEKGTGWMILSMKDDNIPLADKTRNELQGIT